MTSKSVQLKGIGKLVLVTEPKVKASPGNVVVRLTLRPVHPTDIVSYTLVPDAESDSFKDRLVTGCEGIGYVDEVGEGVTELKVGQRVAPLFLKKFYEGDGSWQEYVEVSENEVLILPDSISDELACQATVNSFTAYGLLQTQNVPKGDWLIQDAAASQVGRQVIQLAKHYGIKTINVVRRDDVIDELKSLGGDVVINSSKEDVLEKVKNVTSDKLAYGGLDAIAGEGTKMVASCVRYGGKVLVYGLLSGTDIVMSYIDVGRVQASWWIVLQIMPTPEKTREVAAEVFRLLEKKITAPQPPVKRFSLENYEDAVKLSQQGGRGGKVLLES